MESFFNHCPEIASQVVQWIDYQTCISLPNELIRSSISLKAYWARRYLKITSKDELYQKILCPDTRGAQKLHLLAADLDDVALSQIASHFDTITHLQLGKNPELTDDGIKLLLKKHGTSLQRLSLCQLVHLTNHSLEYISSYCRVIKYLDLRGCMFTASGIRNMLQDGQFVLKALNISRCHLVDTRELPGLVPYFDKLVRIDLSCIDQLEPYQIHALFDACPRLCQINLTSCPEFTLKSIRTLELKRPNIKIYHSAYLEDHTIDGIRRFLLGLVRT